jgi:hypothetical protein
MHGGHCASVADFSWCEVEGSEW